MGRRRKSREIAMQHLFRVAASRDNEAEPDALWDDARLEKDVKKFAMEILRGALDHRETIDARIKQYALHWSIDRIAAVDLAILRVAIAEMLYIPSTPPVVVIDEAVEIAKKFSTADSGAFVNGILDKVKQEVVDAKSDTKGGRRESR